MKNLSKTFYLLAIFVFLIGGSVNANEVHRGFGFDKLARSLCESAKSDQVLQLRTALRRAKAHIRTVYPYVLCDGQSLLSLATLNSSKRVVKYLKLRARPEAELEHKQLVSSK